MSMAVGGDSTGVKSDINITPLIDVVLVLLIIFMVITPMLQKGFDMDIPREVEQEAYVPPDPNALQLILTALGDGTMYLNKTEVARRDLIDEINNSISGHKDKLMFIQADHNLDYGYVVTLMDMARQAGIERVALITKENLDPAQFGK